jgi:hypothetical protein
MNEGDVADLNNKLVLDNKGNKNYTITYETHETINLRFN